MAAHRYWGVIVTSTKQESYLALVRVQMAASAGGTGLIVDTTKASANSVANADNVAAYAADDDAGTKWTATSGTGPFSWWYDFTTPVDIAEVSLTCQSNLQFAPTWFGLIYSDDGSNWTLNSAFSPAAWTAQSLVQTFETSDSFVPSYHWDMLRATFGVTIDSSCLTASGNGISYQWTHIPSTPLSSTGKLYFEGTVPTGADVDMMLGIVNGAAPSSAYAGSDANGYSIQSGGGELYGGANRGMLSNVPTWSDGDVVCMALDVDHKLLWVRSNSNPWNGSASADPATGIGGLDVSSVNGPVCFAVSLHNTGTALKANFGATAFAQVVPKGFTSVDLTQTDSSGPTTPIPVDGKTASHVSKTYLEALSDFSAVAPTSVVTKIYAQTMADFSSLPPQSRPSKIFLEVLHSVPIVSRKSIIMIIG